MRQFEIRVEGESDGYAEIIDPFGVMAFQMLADLVPGIKVIVEYRKIEIDPKFGVPSWTVDSKSWPKIPGTVGGFIMEVPGTNNWLRQTRLIMTDVSRRFFGIQNSDLEKDGDSLKQELPKELKYALAICQDVSGAWLVNLVDKPFDELISALENELPLWICCHIVADLRYSFNNYGLKRGKHDILAKTLAKVISFMVKMATTRVEHQELSHGVVIAPAKGSFIPLGDIQYPDCFKKLKRTPLLSDGNRGVLWISPEGYPIKLITSEWVHQQRKKKRIKMKKGINIGFVSEVADLLGGIGIFLRSDGVITIFDKARPVFIRRGDSWRGWLWRVLQNSLSHEHGEIGKMVFDAAITLSSSGQGGVFGIIDRLPEGLHEKDNVTLSIEKFSKGTENPFSYSEWVFHNLLPTTDVISLGHESLAMLAAIDGATLINKEGMLLAYGAVIPSKSSGAEGARTAAARELSKHGFVIKVSADGPITLYKNSEEIMEV